ncbi:unnamed protein product [Linum trigynum]|uniref:Bifunctional inhibitor/plant lipid transfer protein/seed storage helical domain-containing protein n=1 Tax=Linum trigynum TaxID=586398 RepID=A0AAV2GRH9_9ROSI
MAAATRTTALSIAIMLLTMQLLLWAGGSTAQSPDCSDALTGLIPCLGYITGGSSAPATTCCIQLEKAVRLLPVCLCQVLNSGGASVGLPGFNRTRALGLPAACNVQTPPVSRCNATSPSASPEGSPVAEAPISPGGVPGSDDSSDGSSIKASTSLLLVFFFAMAASYCSSASMGY